MRGPIAVPQHAQTQQPADTDPRLANLPTPEQIAAKVRRQPIGAVLADICRDLGIAPNHPLWNELRNAINAFGGNFIRLVGDRLDRAFPMAHVMARLKANPADPPEPPAPARPSPSPPDPTRINRKPPMAPGRRGQPSPAPAPFVCTHP